MVTLLRPVVRDVDNEKAGLGSPSMGPSALTSPRRPREGARHLPEAFDLHDEIRAPREQGEVGRGPPPYVG